MRMRLSGIIAIVLITCTIALNAQGGFRDGIAFAVRTPSEIKIDGDLSDWDMSYPLSLSAVEQVNSMGLWSDPDDFSAAAYVMWDDENLYVASEVLDDLPFRFLETPLIDGVDALALYLNTDREADPDRSIFGSTDFRVLFAIDNNRFPTAVDRDAVLIKKGLLTSGMNSSGNVIPGYEVAVKATDKGYLLELKLPFSAMANERLPVLKPSPGMRLSFNLQFIDLDEATEDEVDSIGNRVSFITLFPGRPSTRPIDWGLLEFK